MVLIGIDPYPYETIRLSWLRLEDMRYLSSFWYSQNWMKKIWNKLGLHVAMGIVRSSIWVCKPCKRGGIPWYTTSWNQQCKINVIDCLKYYPSVILLYVRNISGGEVTRLYLFRKLPHAVTVTLLHGGPALDKWYKRSWFGLSRNYENWIPPTTLTLTRRKSWRFGNLGAQLRQLEKVPPKRPGATEWICQLSTELTESPHSSLVKMPILGNKNGAPWV
jgi:hypothetical protein